MNTNSLVQYLDKEFEIENNEENLLDFAITDDTKKYIEHNFSEQKSGLIIKGSDKINKVYSTVFVTDEVIEKICQNENCLIFTHHHFNYYEDERGMLPLTEKQIKKVLDSKNSIYVAHAPLDTHRRYSTSIALAKLCNVSIDKFFFNYFGAPTALIGYIESTDFKVFAEFVLKKLERPYLTLNCYNNTVNKIAVIAGGGDMPEILKEVYDNGCDTILTGTVEHRWNLPFIQEGNKAFHELNKKLKLNLIGGTHYGTERPAMTYVKSLFDKFDIDFEFCEDEILLNIK
jgi:putative NIF3 family GTP cyclohydrolase 1 type 2